jgi:hypothetical protein
MTNLIRSTVASGNAKDKSLRATYGISLADYNKMYADQDGRCFVCHKTEKQLRRSKFGSTLAVHHSHQFKKGDPQAVLCLTCGHCNYNILPIFEKDPTVLDRLCQLFELERSRLGMQTKGELYDQ